MLITTLYTALVIFGIGLIIFVHELGHFLAARAVGIRVEAFSIGFGMKIWGYKRGPTEYKICLIPLGGYVKMAGEDPTRPTTGSPDEFGSKKVWQRILVISAGVIMNMVFACVALPVAFSLGVRFVAPVLGAVEPDQPAWNAGLREGDRILSINGARALSFEDIQLEAATTDGPLTLTYEREGITRELTVTPREMGAGAPVIGVNPRYAPEFKVHESVVATEGKEGDALKRARILRDAGITEEDEVLGLNGIPSELFPAWLHEVRDAGDRNLTLLLRRNGVEREVVIPALMEDAAEEKRWLIGVKPMPDPKALVKDVLSRSVAAQMGLKPGDLILEIDGTPYDAAADLARTVGHGHDPDRSARLNPFPDPLPWKPALRVKVQHATGAVEVLSADLPFPEDRARFLKCFSVKRKFSNRVRIMPGRPAAQSGLQDGDRILDVSGDEVSGFDEIVKHIKAADGAPLTLKFQRGDQDRTITGLRAVQYMPQVNTVLSDLYPRNGLYALQSEEVLIPFPDSIGVGFIYAGRMLKRVVKTLRSILKGSVSARHLGGPITIFTVSYKYTQVGFMRGLLFLAVISINLAILNILPIPVLDGGWLMFLIIEKLKGSPVSERAMGYFQWAGLAFILGLMAFVTWNDLGRLFRW